ncbi:MAG TPA: hypothetical protein PLX81_02320, partial [Aliarcobacter cryaerophilus]|nr:hypothetical protein [Aliarcobacter cryaerophilus]
SINIFVKKKSKSKKLADVYHYDLYGKRDFKYEFLDDNSLKTVKWEKLDYSEPNYFFVKKDFTEIKEYEKGFKISDLFILKNAGSATGKDALFVDETKENLIKKLNIENIEFNENNIVKYNYRVFDNHYFLYDNKLIQRLRENLMKNFRFENIALISTKILSSQSYYHSFLTKLISDRCVISNKGQEANYLFPLYLYPDENSLTNEPVPNFNMDIIKDIEKSLNLNFGNWTFSQRVQSTRVQSLEKAGGTEVPLPKEKAGESEVLLPKKEFQALDLFDYIYAVLHSPNYREKYKEFLKIDFPRVPYPKPETFWQLVSLGGKLRSLHLLEDTSLDERIIDIKGEGELLIKNSLNKKDFSIEDEKVELRLNDEVSVVNIPLVAWEFYIGGYQPAQKWLKDRVGRVLNRADMKHYNRIINALCKTDLIMKKIDEVL